MADSVTVDEISLLVVPAEVVVELGPTSMTRKTGVAHVPGVTYAEIMSEASMQKPAVPCS